MGKYSPNIMANYLIGCASHNLNGEVLVFGERRVSWGELWVRSAKIANALVKLGVEKDDKAAFVFHNTPEFLELNYGVQVAGAIPVPVNYRFTAREVAFQVNHSDSVVLIYDSLFAEAVEKAAPELAAVKTFVRRGPGAMESAVDYEDFVSSGNPADPRVANSWDDVAVMIYTGGTTGFPKGVMLTWRAHLDMFANLLASLAGRSAEIELSPEQAERVAEAFPMPGINHAYKFTRNETAKKILTSKKTHGAAKKGLSYLLSHPEVAKINYKNTIKYMVPSMPFFHDASYQILILGAMTGNMCFVLPADIKFNPDDILKIVEREKPVFMANVPAGWKKIANHPDIKNHDLSSLRVAATGAGACSMDLKRKMFEAFPGIIILDMFGQTEMTPITTFRMDTGPETLKERSVGKSIVDARVVDENGKEVPRGEIGEILYRSSTVMKGYYKDEEKTSEVMAGGWFKSGDLGYLDEDGEVRLVDRKKECINTGGEKVFPLEVEEILHEHPAVEDVAVIGVPDEEWGSTVRAVVRLKKEARASEAEIVEFCRDKLAGYKIPKTVVFVDELPLSPVGKVLRQKIRDMYGQA